MPPPRKHSSSSEVEESPPPPKRPRKAGDSSAQSSKAPPSAPRPFLNPFTGAHARNSPERARQSPESMRLSPEAARRSPEAARRSPEAVQKSPEVAQKSRETTRARAGRSGGGQQASAARALAKMAANIGAQSSPLASERSQTPAQSGSGLMQQADAGTAAIGSAAGTKSANAVSQKHVSQNLALLKSKIEKLSAQVNEQEADTEKNTHDLKSALALAEDAAMLAQKLDTRVESLETVLAPLVGRVAALEACARMEKPGTRSSGSDSDGGEKGDDAKAKEAKKKRDRKNKLQDAVRRCLRSFMNVVDTENLPAPLGNGEYWLESEHVGDDGAVVNTRSLRPDWERSWPDNKTGWLRDISHRIKENGAAYLKASQVTFDRVTDAQIDSAIQTCWKTFVKRYKMEKAAKKKEPVDQKAIAKKNGRRRTKFDGRVLYRSLVPELMASRYDYLFQYQYQSSEESTVKEVLSGAIDPLSDNEHSPTPPSTRTVWLSRWPAHRKSQTNILLDRLDAIVALKRAENKTNRGNTYTERRRGLPRSDEKSKLPLMSKKTGILIPRSMISKRWLATKNGQKYDDCAYYTDDEVDEDGEEEEDAYEGDDVEEEDEEELGEGMEAGEVINGGGGDDAGMGGHNALD
ncbi:hypothetical protein VTO73DRAFT_4449 [Trametes versicolor]